MLLSVYEVANALKIEPHRIYYLLKMSRIQGAFKVMNSWRLTEDAVREVIDEGFGGGDSGVTCNIGQQGFDELLENIQKRFVPHSEGQGASCFPRRRRRVECAARRPRTMDRKKSVKQLWLFEELAV